MISVTIIPILEDNYCYLLQAENGETAIIDPGEAQPVIDRVEELGLDLDYILTTHHHGDHIAGNAHLQDQYGAKLAGPATETARIPGMNILLSEKSKFSFGGENVQTLETPGHTHGHICFYFPLSKLVFTGDTLFSMGCGRLFEGTAEQMWDSLQKIAALPGDTLVYCGHEFTQSNGLFCLDLDPGNPDLIARLQDVEKLRATNKPTLPVTIATEKKTNAFLSAGSVQRFAEIRKLKDKA